MVEMTVIGVALDNTSRSPVVLLRDPSGRRQVPIWTDQTQAQNIQAGLKRTANQPSILNQLLAAGGLTPERVIIHAIEDRVFRAVVRLRKASDETVDLDARSSDGILIALHSGVSVWMLEEVVAEASIPVDGTADLAESVAFRRFLDGISPAELARHIGQAKPEPQAAQEQDDDPR